MSKPIDYDDLCRKLRSYYEGPKPKPIPPITDEAADAIAALREQLQAAEAEVLALRGQVIRREAIKADNAALREQVAAKDAELKRITSDRDAKTKRMWELGKDAEKAESDNAALRKELRQVTSVESASDPQVDTSYTGQIATLKADNARLHESLERIARIPNRPFPDRGAHSDYAWGLAIFHAWCDMSRISREAIGPQPEKKDAALLAGKEKKTE